MSLEIFHTDEYKHIVKEHLTDTLIFLLTNGKEFSVAVDIRYIKFSPKLPTDIMDGFGEVVMFAVAGYTFETALVDDESFYFEAGFGAEGFGSKLSMPVLAIKQIFVDEYPLAINITEPIRTKAKHTVTNRSMEALLSNPENQKLLKKK